jgi:hypothetical protein
MTGPRHEIKVIWNGQIILECIALIIVIIGVIFLLVLKCTALIIVIIGVIFLLVLK